jgi:predicted DNA-binding protein (UPF0251 family)
MSEESTITLEDAQRLLGVSRTTLWRLLKKSSIEPQTDTLHRNIKRITVADIRKIREARGNSC